MLIAIFAVSLRVTISIGMAASNGGDSYPRCLAPLTKLSMPQSVLAAIGSHARMC